jgi:sugar/nucleoside kinase (ribokinase family)
MGRGRQILGFGALSVDRILYVDRAFGEGKGRVTGKAVDFGGNVGTALVAAARLGGNAGFIGWLSLDPAADPSGEELERNGVAIADAPRRADARAVQSTIIVTPDGERFIAFDDDIPHGTDADLPDAVLGQGAVLLVDSYATCVVPVVQRARRLGLAVVADIEWTVGAETDALMAACNHLVLPLAFGQSVTGLEAPGDILRTLWSDDREALVLTDGARGAYVRQRGDSTLWHVPAHPVVAIDTTGAGDCFHGAYALGLAEGKAPLSAAAYATAAAALSVTGRGGRAALPGHEACRALMTTGAAPAPLAGSAQTANVEGHHG